MGNGIYGLIQLYFYFTAYIILISVLFFCLYPDPTFDDYCNYYLITLGFIPTIFSILMWIYATIRYRGVE